MSKIFELDLQIESTMASFTQQEERIGQLQRRITSLQDEIDSTPDSGYVSDRFKADVGRFREIDIAQFRSNVEDTIDLLKLSLELVNVEEKRKGYQRELDRVVVQRLKKQERKLKTKRLQSDLRTGLKLVHALSNIDFFS